MTINNSDVASKMLDALSAMGLSIDDLVAAGRGRRHEEARVTIAEFLPKVENAATDGKKKTYATYWRLLTNQYGDKPLTEVKTSTLQALSLFARPTPFSAQMAATEHRPRNIASRRCGVSSRWRWPTVS